MIRAHIGIVVLTLASSAFSPGPRGVTLQFHRGYVTLRAQDVPLSTILSEWARIGHTTIVNADCILDARMTLDLIEVPEGEALNILLKSTSGYVVAARRDDVPSEATFDRILLLRATKRTAPRSSEAPSEPERWAAPNADAADASSISPTDTETGILPVLRRRDPSRRDD